MARVLITVIETNFLIKQKRLMNSRSLKWWIKWYFVKIIGNLRLVIKAQKANKDNNLNSIKPCGVRTYYPDGHNEKSWNNLSEMEKLNKIGKALMDNHAFLRNC